MSHVFATGQVVALAPVKLRQAAAGDYKIMRLLPERRYRIKSADEKHERVVVEDEIELSKTEKITKVEIF